MRNYKYSDEYDIQDAREDAFYDSCDTIFCFNQMEMGYANTTVYDDYVCTCCNDNRFVTEENIHLLIHKTRNHIARKDHNELIKKGDKYEHNYFRIVYTEDGEKQAYADSWKRLIKKGKKK